MNDLVRETLLGVDVVGFCLPADQRIGPGDRHIATELAGSDVVPPGAAGGGGGDQADTVSRARLAEQLSRRELVEAAEVVPVSAVTGYQVSVLADVLVRRLRRGLRCIRTGNSPTNPNTP